MKRPVKLAAASLKALGIVVVLGAVAHAGLPYLPLVGPPPLRLLAMKNPQRAVVIKLEIPPTVAPTNTPGVVEAKVFPGTTNATSTDAVPAYFAASGPLIGGEANQSLEDTFRASIFALPTPDMLSITPQMLATYFRPVQFGTNDGALTGPFHVGFMPPLPLPEPEKSSRAEYIVK
jgi:hypothetical protein